MEQLSKARTEYSRDRQQRLDFINQWIQQQRHAERTFSDLGAAMEEYTKVTGRNLPKLRDPPELADFYVPSEEQKDGRAYLMFTLPV